MKTTKIKAGDLLVSLVQENEGVSLSNLQDLKKGGEYFSSTAPLFTLQVKNLESGNVTTVNSTSGWRTVTVAEVASDKYMVSLSDNLDIVGVSITLFATATQNRISWKVFLQNDSSVLSLIECDYPAITFDAKDSIRVFSPYGSGEHYSSVNEDGYASTQNYPSYGASMQYLAFWDTETRRGMYYGAHDNAPAYKKIHFSRKKESKDFTLKIILPLEDTTSTANSQELHGELVWELFDGDWYDAAMIYRDWAFKAANWTKRGREIPDWLKNTNHWWLVHDYDGFKAEDIAKLNEELGVESAAHIYFWHEIPFDNDYPHYFPIKENFQKEITKLKELGIRSMPYINGRLWDTKDKGAEDWQFSSVAKPFTTKDASGKPFIETYNAKESDGNKVALAIMCPSTALWQEKVKEITDRLFNEVGVDAVYIDQIAAAKPNLCEDPTHNHPAGGGTWWCDSYANLLDHVCAGIGPEKAVTTECTADPFMKYMGAYLSWLWIKNDQVPAFPAIYSEYMPVFGISYGSFIDIDDTCVRVFTAQALLYGEQMGWIKPQQYAKLESKEFYKKLVRTRAKLSNFFIDGRMLRPPFIQDNGPRMQSTKSTEAKRGFDYPAVQGGLWQKPNSEDKLLILINTSDEVATASVSAEIPDGIYQSCGDLETKTTVVNGSFTIDIPSMSVVYYCIS